MDLDRHATIVDREDREVFKKSFQGEIKQKKLPYRFF